MQLLKTTHDVYQGTNTPKDYRSRVKLDEGEREIYMNYPLRHKGQTFFQHQMGRDQAAALQGQDKGTSTLQVVENPSWFSPYYGCVLVGYGLMRHFVVSLLAYLGRSRRKKEATATESTEAAPRGVLWWVPIGFALCLLGWIGYAAVRGASYKHDSLAAPLKELGSVPVVHNGRIQPLDSLARNSLLILRKKQVLNCEPWKGELGRPKMISALEWLCEVAMTPEVAATRPAFRIDNDELKGLLRLPKEASKETLQDGKHYTWNQISPQYAMLQREARRAGAVKSDLRTAYDNSVVKLAEAVDIYQKLGVLFGPGGSAALEKSLPDWRTRIAAGRAAFSARMDGQEHSVADLDWVQNVFSAPLTVPPAMEGKNWATPMQAVVNAPEDANLHPALAGYAAVAQGFRAGNAEEMSAGVASLKKALAASPEAVRPLKKGVVEQRFNAVEPFYKAAFLCVFAFLCGLASWFGTKLSEMFRRTGFWLVVVAMVVLAIGISVRMWLEGRPPVTNLYSSALFIGWGATLLGILLELFWRQSIAMMVASMIGFLTLLVAHFLALDGDTMIMLQAVLDTNIWLATHVVIVTFGYVATFLAGFIGIFYVLRRLIDSQLPERFGRLAYGFAFGTVCFAVLFSFVGTVLGGIWADQSWGRFWGWDPKENGALMIVLWNALMLHARLGGMVKERGFMLLAILGNIVTSWSWFGTNQLGIGLHSYGFTNAAFWSLLAFIAFNVVFLLVGRFAISPAVVDTPPKPQAS
jgi:ABC-type transport system involved in cytochrome c biogenesis permease subunit